MDTLLKVACLLLALATLCQYSAHASEEDMAVFSGGGTRAALGALTALAQFESVDGGVKFGYLAGLSGGAWGVSRYLLERCRGNGTANQAATRIIAEIEKMTDGKGRFNGEWGKVVTPKQQFDAVKMALGGGFKFGQNKVIKPSFFHRGWAQGVYNAMLSKFDQGAGVEYSALKCDGSPLPFFLMDTCTRTAPYPEKGAWQHQDQCGVLFSSKGKRRLDCFQGLHLDAGISEIKGVSKKGKKQLGWEFEKLSSSRPPIQYGKAPLTADKEVCWLDEYAEKKDSLALDASKDEVNPPVWRKAMLRDWLAWTGNAPIEAQRVESDNNFKNLQPAQVSTCAKSSSSSGSSSSSSSSSSSGSGSGAQWAPANVDELPVIRSDQHRFCDAGATCNLPLSALQFRKGHTKRVWMFDFSLGYSEDPYAEFEKCLHVWRDLYGWHISPPVIEDGFHIYNVGFHRRADLSADTFLDNMKKYPKHWAKVIYVPFFSDAAKFEDMKEKFPTVITKGAEKAMGLVKIPYPTYVQGKDQFEMIGMLKDFYSEIPFVFKVDGNEVFQVHKNFANTMAAMDNICPEYESSGTKAECCRRLARDCTDCTTQETQCLQQKCEGGGDLNDCAADSGKYSNLQEIVTRLLEAEHPAMTPFSCPYHPHLPALLPKDRSCQIALPKGWEYCPTESSNFEQCEYYCASTSSMVKTKPTKVCPIRTPQVCDDGKTTTGQPEFLPDHVSCSADIPMGWVYCPSRSGGYKTCSYYCPDNGKTVAEVPTEACIKAGDIEKDGLGFMQPHTPSDSLSSSFDASSSSLSSSTSFVVLKELLKRQKAQTTNRAEAKTVQEALPIVLKGLLSKRNFRATPLERGFYKIWQDLQTGSRDVSAAKAKIEELSKTNEFQYRVARQVSILAKKGGKAGGKAGGKGPVLLSRETRLRRSRK